VTFLEAEILFVFLVLAAFLAAVLPLVWFLFLVRAAFFAAALRFALDIGIKLLLFDIPKMIQVTQCCYFGELRIFRK
jgi:hypothetical protein